MKPNVILSALGALTLTAVIAALVLARNPAATDAIPAGAKLFEVRGQIRSLDAANKTVRIAHEEIPDYMPAMTMPFAVKDARLLNGLAAGDAVQFQLVVTEDDSWIARLQKMPSADVAAAVPAETETTKAAVSATDREAERVQVGETVPDFELIDQNGRPVRLSDFRGQAVVLTFIYTRCPLPNFCPLMSKNFAELEQRLRREFPGKFHLVSVTMDWRFDTPAVLKEYAARYGANDGDWTFATGSAEQIASVAGLMGLYYEWEGGLISHDLRTAIIGPDGRLVRLWQGNVWTPYEVQRVARLALTGTADVAAR